MAWLLIQILTVFILNTCKVAPVQLPGVKGNTAPFLLTQAQPIKLGDSRCTYGGTLFTTWKDQGQPDGIYTEGQDTDFSEEIVCFTVPEGNTAIVTKPGDFKVILPSQLKINHIFGFQ